ncbi:MAG: TonB-dependent receptor [Bacteroidia bacterium]|nr:TonB-dependent receptor [Bacteroidia bacterium]
MNPRLLLFMALCLFSCSAFSQILRGRVLDASNLQPVAASTVENRSLFTFAETAPDGTFSLTIESFPATLIVYKPGYEARIWPLDSMPEGYFQVFLTPAPYEMDSVLITAGETESLLRDQAGSATLIRRHELDRDDQTSIAPALNRVPGVQMQQGALNTARISIRGIGARNPFGTAKIRAYFEDIPLTDGEGGTSLEDLDLSFVEKVEVLRGPTSSVYGAGLGGTIRLSARQPGWNGYEAQLGAQLGAFGTQRYTANGQVANDQFAMQVQGSNTHADGFRENSTYDRTAFAATATWLSGEKSTLMWIGQWADVTAFIPSSIDSASVAEDPTQAAFTWNKTKGYEAYQRSFSGLSWRYVYNKRLEHWISVFGGARVADEVRPFDILRENNRQQGARARWMYRTPTWRMTLGTELFQEGYSWATYQNIGGIGTRGSALSDNRESRRYGNFFAQAHGDLGDRLSWEAGGNLNLTQYDYEDFFNLDSLNLSGSYAFSPTLSPRAALLWKASDWTARVQLSHGFSPPTLAETLTPDGQINPDIAPEKGWNLEAGWRGYLLPRKLWVDATLYRMWVSDLLVARRVGNDQFVGLNAGSSRHDGVEIALNYRPVSSWVLWANYAGQRYRFTDFVDENNIYTGNAVTGVPVHQLSAGTEWALAKGFTANVTSQYVSAIPLRDDNSIYSDAYFLINARLDYLLTYPEWRAKLYVGMNNIANTSYSSMVLVNAGSFGGNQPRYYYPGTPRAWYAGVSFTIKGGKG